MLKRLPLLAVVAVGLLVGAANLAAQGYQVLVNEANPTSSMTVEAVSQLFLKNTTRWDNGQQVVPVDLTANSSVRERFTVAVHGRSVSAVRAYWQRRIFSGRGVPPVEKTSDSEVLAYVSANPNAVGYVSVGATVNGNVKVLRVTDN